MTCRAIHWATTIEHRSLEVSKGLAQVTADLSQVRTQAVFGTLGFCRVEVTMPIGARTCVDDVTRGSAKENLSAGGESRPALLDQLMAISRASALEEMASGIAHEFNQPLGAINTFAQAGERLLNRPDPSIENAREVFQLISKEALAAAEGIRRMRRIFQRDTVIRVPQAIQDVIGELTPALELLANDAGIALDVDIASDLPQVSIDRLRIQHVLYTLTQNALDATSAATKSDARTVRIVGTGDRYGIEICVIDSGPGISAEQQRQLFHPFFTTKARGTGLGLASARAIVEAHEGTIGFTPGTQGGSNFWFRLPAAETTKQNS